MVNGISMKNCNRRTSSVIIFDTYPVGPSLLCIDSPCAVYDYRKMHTVTCSLMSHPPNFTYKITLAQHMYCTHKCDHESMGLRLTRSKTTHNNNYVH